jgi:ferredoxin
MSTIEIYYFSGTGNTLHVARELKNRLPEIVLIPIVSSLKNNELKTNGKVVGILFPIQAHTFPEIVKNFLQKIDLSSASYVFALSSRLCATKVFRSINRLVKRQNRTLDASFAVNTPVNYIPVFAVPTEDEVEEIEAKLQNQLDEISAVISKKETSHEKTGFLVFLLANTLLRVSNFLITKTNFFGLQKSFYADENCIGCGTCEKICLSNKIQLVDNKPVWKSDVDCFYCFACISYCPVQAIQAKGKRTKKKGRYHHPNIKPSDIMEQKK